MDADHLLKVIGQREAVLLPWMCLGKVNGRLHQHRLWVSYQQHVIGRTQVLILEIRGSEGG